MQINRKLMKYIGIAALALVSFFSNAQDNKYIFPAPSPQAIISQVVGNTQLEIEYERPLARNRKIFGGLVPWNSVWRTGAGHCTKMKMDKDVVIEGQQVPRGHYSLFTIPNPDEWVVILNTDTSLYGSYNYSPAKDIARFVVKPMRSGRYYESLTIDVDIIQTNAKLYISWTDIQIDFAIITTTAADAMKFIEQQLVAGVNRDSETYSEAAQYLLFQREHLLQGLDLAQKAIVLDKDNGAARRVKMEIYEYLQLYNEALNEIDDALKMEKNKRYEKEETRKSEIQYWQTHQERIKGKLDKK